MVRDNIIKLFFATLIICFNFLFANEKINNYNYYIDLNNKKTLDEMILFENWESTKSINFSYTNNVYWFKFNLNKKQDQYTNYFLLSKNHKIEDMELFFVEDNKLVSHYKSGFNNPKKEEKEFISRKDFFSIPNSTNIDVYIKIKNNIYPLNLDFEIISNSSAEKFVFVDNFILTSYFTLLVILFIMHFLIYKISKIYFYKHYLIYLFFVIFVGFHNSGILNLYLFKNGINDTIIVFLRLIGFSMIFYFSIFITHFLKIKEDHKNINLILNSLLFILVLSLLLSDVLSIYETKILFFTYLADLTFIVLFLLLFFILLLKSFKKDFISYLLIFIWLPLLISIVIYTINNIYKIFDSSIIEYILRFLFVYESIFISLIIAYKYNLIEKEKEQLLIASKDKEILYLRQSKLIKMGEMLNNIAHQWKQPLARINSIVFKSYDLIDENKKDELKKELLLIENETSNMSNTVSSLLSFFHINKIQEELNLFELATSEKEFIEKNYKNINFQISCEDKTITTIGYKNEYSQVLRVLIENAIDSIIDSKIEKPIIKICISKDTNIPILSIENNGEKINENFLDKIFEPYFTTKNKNHHQGIGLYMSKMLIEESMNKKLNVDNTSLGVKFIIKG